MDIDPREHGLSQERGGGLQRLQSFREPAGVGYGARRHSIAAGLPGLSRDRHSPGWPQGTKRKIPAEHDTPSPGKQEMDPLLAGSSSITDGDMPAPKRRGSAFDTQKIAQLSLSDRRHSITSGDARASGGSGGPWWGGERRDSAPTMSASTPPSAFPADSPHGRPPGGIATFAWPANPQDQPPMQTEPNVNMPGPPPHPYDPLAIMPPVSFAPDRRMSATNLPPENLSTPPSTGPTRVLRSRSRPPSRVRGASQSDSNVAGPSSGAGTADQPLGHDDLHTVKESGSTPYSRSPELRVSHKLAERKRRKEMKELFDELREHLPADRGMKASKWEILSKGAFVRNARGDTRSLDLCALCGLCRLAIDFIGNLKHTVNEMQREIDILRHEVESLRHGVPPYPGGPPPPPGVMYAHGPPPVGVPSYSHTGPAHPPPGPPGPPSSHQPPPTHHAPPPSQPPPLHSMHPPIPHSHGHPDGPSSRPPSSQNTYAGAGPPPMSLAPGGPGVPMTKTDPSS